jgi:splicing factor 1
MGQDGEEAAELLATIRGDHVAMKNWYNNSCADDVVLNLKKRFGSTYPEFWRDVLHWEGYKETRKAYLTYTEQGRRETSGSPANTAATTATTTVTRKRRSRWETDPNNTIKATTSSSTSNTNDETAASTGTTTKRKSRWERTDITSGTTSDNHHHNKNNNNIDAALAVAMNVVAATSGTTTKSSGTQQQEASKGVLEILPELPAGLTEEQQLELAQLQQRLRIANERLTNLDAEAARVDALPRGHPDRSPSPPPIYGADGKRRNTRAVRWREHYTNERAECLEKICDINPALRPPGFVRRKRTKKIYIPVDEHPTYNFIGLIIGPRGKTQKEMELSTNCKIAIRGRGSIKEGARGRRDGKMLEGDDEPLHVVVTGDEQENVERAAKMIEDMLIVIDDDKNVHKQQQLRELALLNGTLKDDDYCTTCAEKGHRHFECPKRFAYTKNTVQVKCAICGDSSHPTRDCTQGGNNSLTTNNNSTVTQNDQNQMDSDYLSFMAELDGKPKVDHEIPASYNKPEDPPAAQSSQQIVSAEGQQQIVTSTAAVTDTVGGPLTTTLSSSSTNNTVNITTPAPVNFVLPPYGYLPSGLPPPPPPPLFSGVTQVMPPQHMASTGIVPPPAYVIPPPPPLMAASAPMMIPPSYSAPIPGYYDPSSLLVSADGLKQQQQNATDARSSKGKKKKKRDGIDELEGWDPSVYYNQGGTDPTGAVGFNWWEQT